MSLLDLELHPKQGLAYLSKATEILYGGSAGGGKALSLDTPIPTPAGWATMGELQVGDQVLGRDGRPCNVVAKSAVHYEDTYRITFSDGEEIVAGTRHRWITSTDRERIRELKQSADWRARRRASRPSRAKGIKSAAFVASLTAANSARAHHQGKPLEGVRTTSEILDTLTCQSARLNHSVRVCAPLELPEAPLLIDPYVLGAWLGDGTSSAGTITGLDEEIFEQVANYYPVTRLANPSTRGTLGLKKDLRTLGVLGNKHIPAAYLRGSKDQRLALLQGLMDTDGYCDQRGMCEFTQVRKVLADQVLELICSLGIKAAMCVGAAKLNGRLIGPKYRIKFVSELPIFRLARKLIRQKRAGFRGTHDRRYIVSVEPVQRVPLQCIRVDSEDHTYLVGRSMIPTHNSHLVRVALICWCLLIAGLECYIFRRVMEDLINNHVDGPKGFRNMLAPLVDAGYCTIIETEIRFWNGSKIHLCHCKDDKHRYKYHGAEIHVLVIDELTTFSEIVYRYLRFRVRMVGLKLPPELAGCFPRILNCSNPGNIGHSWVKRTFIDGRTPMDLYRQPDEEGGMLRQYVPARLEDNPSMDEDDPTYRARMRGLGSPELVRAMEQGDWDVIAGAFFSEWDPSLHVLQPFNPPLHATRIRGMDWGSARPFSVGWYAISDGTWPLVKTSSGRVLRIPKDALVRYREWYGCMPNQDNVGLKMTAEEVADGIKTRSVGEKYAYTVCDPSMFAEDGGPSIAERMHKRGLKRLRPGDNQRVRRRGSMGGWDQLRFRLRGDPNEDDGLPLFYTMENQFHINRTLPAAQHDELNLEDLNTQMEDHAIDEARYTAMSRPRIIREPIDPKTLRPKPGSFEALTKGSDKPRSRYRMTA